MTKRELLKSFAAVVIAWAAGTQRTIAGTENMNSQVHKAPFGSCCKDLKDAITTPPNSFFFVEKNNVLYLTVGYAQTDKGPSWFDQAVIFCPFCGKQLQTKEEIAKKANGYAT